MREIENGIQMDFTECEVHGVFSSRVGKFASLKLKISISHPQSVQLIMHGQADFAGEVG